MEKHKVAIVKYEKPLESVRKAVELSNGLARLPANAKVFIKPKMGRHHHIPDHSRHGCVAQGTGDR
jgi:uncharacterized protein (DUF362 family)